MDRTKHRFNFIDVLIIVAVLIVTAVLVKIYIIDEKNEVQLKNTTVQYVVCTDALSEEIADNISEGDFVYDYSSKKEIGTVTACDIRTASHTGVSQNGEAVVSEIVGYKVLYITIEGTATVYDDGYLIGNIPVRAGTELELMLPDLYCTAECISIEVIG